MRARFVALLCSLGAIGFAGSARAECRLAIANDTGRDIYLTVDDDKNTEYLDDAKVTAGTVKKISKKTTTCYTTTKFRLGFNFKDDDKDYGFWRSPMLEVRYDPYLVIHISSLDVNPGNVLK